MYAGEHVRMFTLHFFRILQVETKQVSFAFADTLLIQLALEHLPVFIAEEAFAGGQDLLLKSVELLVCKGIHLVGREQPFGISISLPILAHQGSVSGVA